MGYAHCHRAQYIYIYIYHCFENRLIYHCLKNALGVSRLRPGGIFRAGCLCFGKCQGRHALLLNIIFNNGMGMAQLQVLKKPKVEWHESQERAKSTSPLPPREFPFTCVAPPPQKQTWWVQIESLEAVSFRKMLMMRKKKMMMMMSVPVGRSILLGTRCTVK